MVINTMTKRGYSGGRRYWRKNESRRFRSLLETASGIAVTLAVVVSVIAFGFLLVWIAHLIFD